MLQVLLTLEWLLGTEHLVHMEDAQQRWRSLNASELQLAKALWQLLHLLIMQHLPNTAKDLQEILAWILICAAPSVKQPGLQDWQPMNEITTAAAKRLAQDKAAWATVQPLPRSHDKNSVDQFAFLWAFLGE